MSATFHIMRRRKLAMQQAKERGESMATVNYEPKEKKATVTVEPVETVVETVEKAVETVEKPKATKNTRRKSTVKEDE